MLLHSTSLFGNLVQFVMSPNSAPLFDFSKIMIHFCLIRIWLHLHCYNSNPVRSTMCLNTAITVNTVNTVKYCNWFYTLQISLLRCFCQNLWGVIQCSIFDIELFDICPFAFPRNCSDENINRVFPNKVHCSAAHSVKLVSADLTFD